MNGTDLEGSFQTPRKPLVQIINSFETRRDAYVEKVRKNFSDNFHPTHRSHFWTRLIYIFGLFENGSICSSNVSQNYVFDIGGQHFRLI